MAHIAGQRAEFTFNLNKYNRTDDKDERENYARKMAKYIRNAPIHGFTVEQVTQGQSYPADVVNKYLDDPTIGSEPDISEGQAIDKIKELVDTKNVQKWGAGSGIVYAYGYRCAPDRLKIGSTTSDAVQRIAEQIYTSTPDVPVLYLEIRTNKCRALEKTLHAILEYQGKKVIGGGDEWFLTSVGEIDKLCDFLGVGKQLQQAEHPNLRIDHISTTPSKPEFEVQP